MTCWQCAPATSDGHGRSRWLIIAGLLLLGTTTPVRADLSAQMDQLFGSLVNVTAPTAHWGQRRGVLSGGSVVARHCIVDVGLDHRLVQNGVFR